MNRMNCLSTLLGTVCLMAALSAASPAPQKMERAILEDKIRGGWAGKMIGVSYGAPTEFKSNGKIFEAPLEWSPERVSNSLQQDDLYVGMTLAETMDRLGFNATSRQYGEAFARSQYRLWHANAAARRLLNLGIEAPRSGHPRYNIHANDIDFQIEADFIGLMSPGLPRYSNQLCDRVGRVMNYGDGLYGGMFICGMYTAAFIEKDPRRVVEQGLACLPPGSGYARLIRDVLQWSTMPGSDWRQTWQKIQDQWDRDDSCPNGSLRPFNIDARLNGAYIALGLLYGERDFERTLEISTRSGQDSDCNPSTAGGILGVMLGYGAIPERWKSGIPAIADRKFDYTQSSFNDISRLTLRHALDLIRKAGGKVTDQEVIIKVQAPKPPRLEQWDMGVPDRRVEIQDPAWKWDSAWVEERSKQEPARVTGRRARQTGATVELEFSGSAIALVGVLSQEGGRADVFLDGKKMSRMEAYIVERTNDSALWHAYGLKNGPHRLRIVSRPDADPRSKGKTLIISEAVTYRPTR